MVERLTLKFDGQELNLKFAILGGIMDDITSAPLGMFLGNLDPVDANLVLMHTLRAYIKMNVEEHRMNLDQVEKLIEFSLQEALKREREQKNIENVSLENHKEIILKM